MDANQLSPGYELHDELARLCPPAANRDPNRKLAWVATACGLGIAIFALISFNFFTAQVTQLQFELETAATNVEVMVSGTKANQTLALEPANRGR